MTEMEIIKNNLIRNNIHLDDEKIEKLHRFYQLLIENNNKINLTAITDINEVSVKHFADSIILNEIYDQNATVCDIGSGAGFPGIPLKIARPDLHITLVDSLKKRIDFLNLVIKELNLTNITAIHSRAQELQNNNVSRETFDYTITRAVAKLNIISEYCLPYTKTNGKMIAYKSLSYKTEIDEAKNALDKLGGNIENILKNTLFSQKNEVFERNLIIINKISSTPLIYPRAKNKIEKQPL